MDILPNIISSCKITLIFLDELRNFCTVIRQRELIPAEKKFTGQRHNFELWTRKKSMLFKQLVKRLYNANLNNCRRRKPLLLQNRRS